MIIRPSILGMHAYKPPLESRSTDPDWLLADFNERTLPVSKHVTTALNDYINNNRIHIYPEYGSFLKKLSAYVGVDESEIMITNGSDQGIDLIYRAVTEPGDEVIVPTPTFAILTHCAEVQGLIIHQPTYSIEEGYPLEQVLKLISEKTRLIVVCNPNNPTGTLTSKESILAILQAAPEAAVLVDECYFEYTSLTVKDFIHSYPNLLITRTFSKTWGLSALRIGYIISCQNNIDNLLKIRGPYDVNVPAVVAATAALDDPSYMTSYVRELKEIAMPKLLDYLQQKAITFWPTEANFVLIQPKVDPKELEKSLRKFGILVRPRSGSVIENTLRVSIGTNADVNRLIAALEAC